jgi:ankyrin repeat protein
MEHIQIFHLLIENKLLDPDQTYEIPNPTIDKKDSDDEMEITWPLFVASEKGDPNLFTLLISKCSKESVLRQNKKGSYCLWIASCNKHIDIVSMLISAGADPNQVNVKGENSIIPACQKSQSIVEILLVAGARLDLYDKTRDNPFILCCRTDQSQILEMFLQRMKSNELDFIHTQYADIDGFNPLHAAVEQNRVNCIRVLFNYRANLEWKTMPDNPIISGATALHLACFYDMLESFKLLQEFGANLYAQTDVGEFNCMHIAVRRGHMRIVGYLMSLKDAKDIWLTQKDSDGRVPGYYAQISGNEAIYEEYFCNRLTQYMEKLIYAPPDVTELCSNVIIKYGQSLGVYEYPSLTNLDLGRGVDLATMAILNKSQTLYDTLIRLNVDMNRKDDYGVCANFWKALMESDTETVKMIKDTDTDTGTDPEVDLMLRRLESIRSKSLQNKILLSTPNKPPTSDDKDVKLIGDDTGSLTGSLTALLKMNNGYDQKVDKSIISMLKRTGSIEQSLLGFIDKLKGKDSIELVLWNARIHMIKLIAIDEKYLSPVQIMALYLYTSSRQIFEQVNLTLSQWASKSASIWHPFIFTLYQAIESIPRFEGEVYRTINYKFDRDIFKIGTEVTWSTFSICSKEYSSCVDAIKRDTGIIFIVKSKSGRDIGRYSPTPVDQDVIFLPGSKFVITNYFQANQITLAQANIREKTFKIRDKDIENAINGKCIIIEVVES